MAKTTHTYKWDINQNFSENFSFETRYYDLGASSEPKNIYKIGVSVGLASTASTTFLFPTIEVDYRTSTTSAWSFYDTFMTGSVGDWTSNQAIETVVRSKKLKKVPGIQLRIRGLIPERFIINDISIEYRHLRKKAIGRPQ